MKIIYHSISCLPCPLIYSLFLFSVWPLSLPSTASLAPLSTLICCFPHSPSTLSSTSQLLFTQRFFSLTPPVCSGPQEFHLFVSFLMWFLSLTSLFLIQILHSGMLCQSYCVIWNMYSSWFWLERKFVWTKYHEFPNINVHIHTYIYSGYESVLTCLLEKNEKY